MDDATNRSELEVLSEEECLRLLASRTLGRVAIAVDGQPQIFPVNYAVAEGRVVFRTAAGTKLEHGPMSRAAFEIDEFDPATGVGWSVMVQGVLHEVTGTVDRVSEPLRRLAIQPLAPGQREHFLAVYPSVISGRRFALAPPAG